MTLLFLSFMRACYMRTLYVKKGEIGIRLFSIVCTVPWSGEIVFLAIVPIGPAHPDHAFSSAFWIDTCSSSTAIPVCLVHWIVVEGGLATARVIALDTSLVRPQAKPACPRFYTKCRVHRHIHSLDIRGVMFSVQRYIFSTNHQH